MKVEPVSGVAVSITGVLAPNATVQVVAQSRPAGAEIVRPVPLPVLDTVRVYVLVGAATANAAVTVWAVSIVTVQVPVPAHPPPLQPVKAAPVAGVAVRVTVVVAPKGALQTIPQSIPAGVERTLPLPARDTLNVGAVLGGV
jgi:hypothetical protein